MLVGFRVLGYKLIKISTIVDYAAYGSAFFTGYKLIKISTIVDSDKWLPRKKGYKLIKISTIVDHHRTSPLTMWL